MSRRCAREGVAWPRNVTPKPWEILAGHPRPHWYFSDVLWGRVAYDEAPEEWGRSQQAHWRERWAADFRASHGWIYAHLCRLVVLPGLDGEVRRGR